MMLDEMVQLFMDSRKRGTTGARAQCTDKTLKIYRDNMKVFTGFMVEAGIVRYEDIRRMHIVQFLDWADQQVKDGRWKLPSERQVLRSLRTFFRWVDLDEDCQQEGLRGLQRYLPAIPKNPPRQDIPQNGDLKKFKNTFNTSNRWAYRDYVAVSLMASNGMRLGELCNLKVDCCKLDDRLLVVDGKEGIRLVPITIEMVRLLKGWLKRREGYKSANDSPYVFISKYDGKMTVDGFGKSFRKHRKRYGLPRVTAHTFRHAFCTTYLKNGGDIEKLRHITGHSTFEMLKNYLHIAQLGSKEAQEELEKVNLLREV